VVDAKIVKKKAVKEEALDELKKSTLVSYAKKATGDAFAQGYDAANSLEYSNNPDVDYETAKNKGKKRVAGVALAAKKLAKEETVNEVSTSTIAKLATARYGQAQAALKQKDFGGYVKNMKKAIKAGDATTPKTGWSPEDDGKKNEEVILSAQEKYRQIKEAKARKALRGAGPQGPESEKPKMKNSYEYTGKKKRPNMGDLPADVKLHGEEAKIAEGSWDKEQAERERQAKLPKKDDEGDTGLFAGVLPTKGSKPLSKAQQKAFDSVMKASRKGK
jgi:hypothetical protein